MDIVSQDKIDHLQESVGTLCRAAVAFSGGVDSSYLLAVCVDLLGPERVLAVTVDSPLLPRRELAVAKAIAQELGVRHEVLRLDELAVPEVAKNPPDRCYHCKRMRFESLEVFRQKVSGDYELLHGENADDQLDYRPGSRAAKELGVLAPLAEAGLTKDDIRRLSRERGLETWNHPAAACLATRFPYGEPLSKQGLARVEQAEHALHELLGAGGLRIRDHFPVARIEIAADQIARLAAEPLRSKVSGAVRATGYLYVSLDLDGYRMGSMNDELDQSDRAPE